MQITDLLIEEGAIIKEAVEQLERVRCKVVYVVDNGKLSASVSDGDVRRYALGDGDTALPIKYIANYQPEFLVSYDRNKVDELFRATDVPSIPIVNYNGEVIEVVFKTAAG